MPLRKLIAIGAVLVLLSVAGWFAAAWNGAFDLPLSALRARYALPDSRYADIDGIEIHYVDEGTGPPVVLVHASWLSLRSWNALAADLRRDHRVIRFDWPGGAGLSGPDSRQRYSNELSVAVLAQLLETLDTGPATIVGTSSGGMIAFHYAAQYPARVSRLVLINTAGMPRTKATNPNRQQGAWWQTLLGMRYQTRGFWQQNLQAQFGDTPTPAESFVTEVYDLNRRAGGKQDLLVTLGNFRTGDPQALLARITAPTFIMWGQDNIAVSPLEADVIEHWLTGTRSLARKYPGLGHYLYLEDPALAAREVRAFLSGALDADLRRTIRE